MHKIALTFSNTESEVSSSPILEHVVTDDIKATIYNANADILKFHQFPCHTQAVERCIKVVTEASYLVIGQDARSGFIRTIIKSRQKVPSFETKAENNLS